MRINLLYPVLLVMILSCGSSKVQKSESVRSIEAVLDQQERAWNNYDLEGFMEGYWKSDNLKFYGSNGITSGWEETLENYRIRYPNTDHTGTLDFKIEDINKINEESYYVMGRYYLQRKAGDANGRFMLIFKKINGSWKIIADMTS